MNADDKGSSSARDAAIDWWMRRKEGALTRAEQARFEAWLADPANRAAFDDISRMCDDLAALRPARPARPRHKASLRARLAGAAAFAAAGAALFVAYDDLSAYLLSDYYAGTGETKRVTLEDGSRVELDARSAIAVDYTSSRRRLTLLEGEAWFSVARDPTRPFVVEAEGGTIRALGTSFDVALAKGGARVTVTEHRVAVTSGGTEIVVREDQESTYVKDAPARAPSRADVARLTAWRRGKLIVENEPLGEVLGVLGRYRHGLVTCLRPSICARRVSGVFGTEDPLQAIAEIETFLGLRAFRLTDYLIVLHE